MLRIGLTGGIGSGKSEVARRFDALGIPVIDTDVLAREIVAPGQPLLDAILDVFGEDLRLKDGSLDRRTLRTRVFQQPELRKRLEAMTHPGSPRPWRSGLPPCRLQHPTWCWSFRCCSRLAGRKRLTGCSSSIARKPCRWNGSCGATA
jgi:hypothetical protein